MENFLTSDESRVANELLVALEELLPMVSGDSLRVDLGELKSLSTRVKVAQAGYPFVLNEQPAQNINRLGSVLLGPVYTSDSYPWPMDEDGNPMAPLCQLNTAEFPKQIEGVEGLVQVWLAQSGAARGASHIRVIAAAGAGAEKMTPVIVHTAEIDVLLPEAAEWVKDFHSLPKPSKKRFMSEAAAKLGHATDDDLADADWDTWCRLSEEYGEKFGDDLVTCMQITSFGQARVYCDIAPDQKKAVEDLAQLRKRLEKKGASADELRVSQMAKVGKAFKDWMTVLGEQEYPCLFGTFQPIQYYAEHMDTPIICFESIGLREWGDGGNAQVFYSKEHGFKFDWSCS